LKFIDGHIFFNQFLDIQAIVLNNSIFLLFYQ